MKNFISLGILFAILNTNAGKLEIEAEELKTHKSVFTTNMSDHFRCNANTCLKHLKGTPVHALEIGSFDGGSAAHLMSNFMNHADSTLTCIDPWEISGVPTHADKIRAPGDLYASFSANLRPWILSGRVDRQQGFSQDIVPQLSVAKKTYNFVFIDGDHSAPGVLTDAIMTWHLLEKGSIMAFDDYLWRADIAKNRGKYKAPHERPQIAIDGFLACYKDQFDILVNSYQLWIRKK